MKKMKITMTATKKSKYSRYIDIIIIAIIITCGVVAVQIYYNERQAECIANPLVYAAKQIEDSTGAKFVGSGTLISSNQAVATVNFDSNNSLFEDLIY